MNDADVIHEERRMREGESESINDKMRWYRREVTLRSKSPPPQKTQII